MFPVIVFVAICSLASASRIPIEGRVRNRNLLQATSAVNLTGASRILLSTVSNSSICVGRDPATNQSALADCPRTLNTANSWILVIKPEGNFARFLDVTDLTQCLSSDADNNAVWEMCSADSPTQKFSFLFDLSDTPGPQPFALVRADNDNLCLAIDAGANTLSWTTTCSANLKSEGETDCTDVPGFISTHFVDSYSIPSLRVDRVGPKPDGQSVTDYLQSVADKCSQDCRCTHITSYGDIKSLGPLAPLDPSGWNVCLYQRSTPVSCCPDVPGYNKTVGQLSQWGVYETEDPLDASGQPAAANAPWTVDMITPLANTCAGDCACVAFNNELKPNLYDQRFLTPVQNLSLVTAAPTNRCIYTANPAVCASNPAVYQSRVSFRNAVKGPNNCVAVTDSGVGFSTATPAVCPGDRTSAFWVVAANGDTNGAANILAITEGIPFCLGVTQPYGPHNAPALNGKLEADYCVNEATYQQFYIRKIVDGRYEILSYTDRTLCLRADDNSGSVSMGKCASSKDKAGLDLQRFQIELETACPVLDGYDAIGAWTVPTGDNLLRVSAAKNRNATADDCTSDCKCLAFSFGTGANAVGALRSTDDRPQYPSGVNECYYIKQSPVPCGCPVVAGFTSTLGADGADGGSLWQGREPPRPRPIADIGAGCLADCRCNSFTSNGFTYSTSTSTPSSNKRLCFYARANASECSVKCPETNLACLTSKFSALQLPQFPVKLPSFPIPDDTVDILDVLDPPTLVAYVQGIAAASSGGDLKFGCPQALLPIFRGDSIGDNKALKTLSGGACGNMKPLADNSYIVGAISTAAADFAKSVGPARSDRAKKAKKDGKDYGICAAIDPCSRDLYLGFVGLSVKVGLGLGPLTPPTLTMTLKSLAYSDSGNGAGIAKTSLGLWTYKDKVDTVNNGVAIMGNTFMSVNAVLTWGFQAGSVKICTVTINSDVQIVTRASNPTRFALQIAAKPTIDLYPGGGFIVDLRKVVDSLSIDVLFYVEHYNDNNFNMYTAVNVRSDLPTLLSAFAGPLGQVLKELVSSDSNLNVLINIHMDPRGAGIRLFFTGQIALGGKLGGFITKVIPQAKISFTAGVGAKLSIVPIKGRNKVFGSVFIQGQEFSFAPCGDSSDCMSDQVCYTGFCAKKLGCTATKPFEVGNAIKGVFQGGFGSFFSSGSWAPPKTCSNGLVPFNGVFCKVKNCPSDFPQFCNNGVFGTCVKLGVECSFDKLLASLFGNCPGI